MLRSLQRAWRWLANVRKSSFPSTTSSNGKHVRFDSIVELAKDEHGFYLHAQIARVPFTGWIGTMQVSDHQRAEMIRDWLAGRFLEAWLDALRDGDWETMRQLLDSAEWDVRYLDEHFEGFWLKGAHRA